MALKPADNENEYIIDHVLLATASGTDTYENKMTAMYNAYQALSNVDKQNTYVVSSGVVFQKNNKNNPFYAAVAMDSTYLYVYTLDLINKIFRISLNGAAPQAQTGSTASTMQLFKKVIKKV